MRLLCFILISAGYLLATPRLSDVHGAQPLVVHRIADGFFLPLFLTAPSGETDRAFVVEQHGHIEILDLASGTKNATPFLDLTSVVNSGGNEQGLLGFAFDPN